MKNGGTNPYFEEEDILLWLDQDNWVDNLKVSVLDEDAKEDKPIGVTEFSLLPYMKQRPEDAREDTFDLFYMMQTDPKDDTEVKEVASGEIAMRVSFICDVFIVIRVSGFSAISCILIWIYSLHQQCKRMKAVSELIFSNLRSADPFHARRQPDRVHRARQGSRLPRNPQTFARRGSQNGSVRLAHD